jgi:hypothetical protein
MSLLTTRAHDGPQAALTVANLTTTDSLHSYPVFFFTFYKGKHGANIEYMTTEPLIPNG